MIQVAFVHVMLLPEWKSVINTDCYFKEIINVQSAANYIHIKLLICLI